MEMLRNGLHVLALKHRTRGKDLWLVLSTNVKWGFSWLREEGCLNKLLDTKTSPSSLYTNKVVQWSGKVCHRRPKPRGRSFQRRSGREWRHRFPAKGRTPSHLPLTPCSLTGRRLREKIWGKAYSFSIAAIMSYHKLCALKQHRFIISQPVGQTSSRHLTWLKPRCQQAEEAPEHNPITCLSCWQNSVSCLCGCPFSSYSWGPFPACRGQRIPWFMALFLHLQAACLWPFLYNHIPFTDYNWDRVCTHVVRWLD